MCKVINIKPKVVSKNITEAPEIRRAIVRIAHKIKSSKSQGQLVKINDHFFRIKELG